MNKMNDVIITFTSLSTEPVSESLKVDCVSAPSLLRRLACAIENPAEDEINLNIGECNE